MVHRPLQNLYESVHFDMPCRKTSNGLSCGSFDFHHEEDRQLLGILCEPLPASSKQTPIEGGSANDYDYANQDPIDLADLNGNEPCPQSGCTYEEHSVAANNAMRSGVYSTWRSNVRAERAANLKKYCAVSAYSGHSGRGCAKARSGPGSSGLGAAGAFLRRKVVGISVGALKGSWVAMTAVGAVGVVACTGGANVICDLEFAPAMAVGFVGGLIVGGAIGGVRNWKI